MPVTLQSSIRQRQEQGVKSLDGLEAREITATAETYGEAKAELEQQLPEGWILLGIMRLADDQT